MYKSYADTLESYTIAEEGFVSTIVGTAVFIGGIALLGKISDIKSRNKLKKIIKTNAGEPSDYGNSTYNILRKYSKDITGVVEPIKSNEYIKLWSEALVIANALEAIRQSFSKIDPREKSSASKYTQLDSKLSSLLFKADSNLVKRGDLDMSELSSTTVSLESSNIKKLQDILFKTFAVLWSGGHDGYSLIMTEEFYFSDKSEDIRDIPEARKCIDSFDHVVRVIIDDDEPETYLRSYISKCKFAIDPNSDLK